MRAEFAPLGDEQGMNPKDYAQIVKIAKKYRLIHAFYKKHPNLYHWVRKRVGVSELMKDAKLRYRRKNITGYSLEECLRIAKRHGSIAELLKKDKGVYIRCSRKGWLPHLHDLFGIKNHRGYLTKEKCTQLALLCSTKKDFRKNYPAAYRKVLKNKWNSAMDHMVVLGSLKERYIYAYEHSDNTAYVGLTYNIKARHRDHMSRNEILKSKKHLNQTLKVLCGPISREQARQKERDYIHKYKKNGWVLLNKAPGGSLGNKDRVYCLGTCVDILKKCKTRTQAYKTSAMGWMIRNGYKDMALKVLPKSKNKPAHSIEGVLKKAARYKTYSRFIEENKGMYLFMYRNGKLGLLQKILPPKLKCKTD